MQNGDKVDVDLGIAFRSLPQQWLIDLIEQQLRRANLIWCDASDGKVRFRNITIGAGDGYMEDADIWVTNVPGRSYSNGEHVVLLSSMGGDVIAHELGHYMFMLGDSYDEQRRSGPCGIGPGFDVDGPEPISEVWNTIMQQSGGQVCRDPSGRSLAEINPEWGNAGCYNDSSCWLVCTDRTACPTDPSTGNLLSFTCPQPPPLFSELSVQLNHDLRRGTGQVFQNDAGARSYCPPVRPGKIMVLGAKLNPDEHVSFPGPGQPGRLCGNGKIDVGEQCDGYNFGGQTCQSLGYPTGNLSCYPNCGLDTRGCIINSTCGDGSQAPEKKCNDSGTVITVPANTTCSSFGFDGMRADDPALLFCDTNNCGINVSQCPGHRAPFDPSTLEKAESSSTLVNVLELIDSLGRVEGRSDLPRGQSSHLLWIFLEHLQTDAWVLHLYGRCSEYETANTGELCLLSNPSLWFSGEDLVQVGGSLGVTTISVRVGGAPTPAFRAGSDGARGDPVDLEIRLAGLKQQKWTTPSGGTGPSKWKQVGLFAGEPGTAEALQVGNCNDEIACQYGWRAETGRFEATHHTLMQYRDPYQAVPNPVLSDWAWMVKYLAEQHNVSIKAPSEFPNPQIPTLPNGDPDCDGPINFVNNVQKPDQLFLVLDRSGSMDTPANSGPGGGATRFEYAKSAARAIVSLMDGKPADVGLILFSSSANVEQELIHVSNVSIPPTPSITAADFIAKIDALTIEGGTDANGLLAPLTLMADGFASKPNANSRAAVLLTDEQMWARSWRKDCWSLPGGGEVCFPSLWDQVSTAMLNLNTTVQLRRLGDLGVQFYSVPLGQASDGGLAAFLAAQFGERRAGGRIFRAPVGDEAPAISLEVHARTRSEALARARTPSAVAYTRRCSIGEFPCGDLVPTMTPFGCLCLGPGQTAPALPPEESFEIPVEAGARRLNIMLSGRNAAGSEWNPRFALLAPDGATRATDESAGVVSDRFFRLTSVDSPAEGTWRLKVAARDQKPDQHSYLTAHVENPGPGCFAQVNSVRTDGSQPIVITVQAYQGGAMIERGVSFSGEVRRPDRSIVPLTFERVSVDPLVDAARFDGYVGRGLYDVTVRCQVGAGAELMPGESIWGRPATLPDGTQQVAPALPPIAMHPFVRDTRAGFFVDSAASAPLPPGDDCDGDGIPNSQEPPGDTDLDGLDDVCDDDADGDDVPDWRDPNPRLALPSDCRPDANPPVLVAPSLDLVRCVPVPQSVSLGVSTTDDSCPDPNRITLVGRLLSVNGKAPPSPVTVQGQNPSLVLPVGTTVIEWTATDVNGNRSSAQQTIVIRHEESAVACCKAGQRVIMGDDTPNVFVVPSPEPVCVFGKGSGDVIITGSGADFVSGGSGPDVLQTGTGGDVVLGGDDPNTITVGAGPSFVCGGSSNDTITVSGGGEIHGGAGNDTITALGGSYLIVPGAGSDVVVAGASNDVIVIRDVCEIAQPKVLDGGGGYDILYSPVSAAELVAKGFVLVNLEQIVVTDANRYLAECF